MARIPINNKLPNTAGYTVLNTDTGRIETFSDGSFKVVSGIDVSTQEYPSGYNKILIDGVEKLLGSEVVEEGENASGKYIKYENGIMICFMFNFPLITTPNNLICIYYSYTYISNPVILFEIYKSVSDIRNFFVWELHEIYNTYTYVIGRLAKDTDVAPDYDPIESLGHRCYFTIGRWK